MSDIDVFQRMSEIAATPQFAMVFGDDNELTRKVVEHREWLKSIRHERPSPEIPFKVGIYIRYFNQTRYENYLEFHKKQFEDTIALCPNWTLRYRSSATGTTSSRLVIKTPASDSR